jgi:hypothetical protein
MTMAAVTRSHTTPHSIGELCVGGDWAQADGDFETLRHIAQQLATRAGEPLHCELTKLADLCLYDLDRASALWDQLKGTLFGRRAR